MRAVWRFGFILLGVVALIIAIGFVLPREVSVSRSVVVAAPAEQVFPYVNGFRRFNEWQPWAARDPQTEYTFSGPETGKGARMVWQSDEFGAGSQEIIVSKPPKRSVFALDFGKMGEGTAAFSLSPEDGHTRVTWSFHTDLGGNPFMRWMGLMFDSWLGADYEAGLARLKRLVETGSASRS